MFDEEDVEQVEEKDALLDDANGDSSPPSPSLRSPPPAFAPPPPLLSAEEEAVGDKGDDGDDGCCCSCSCSCKEENEGEEEGAFSRSCGCRGDSDAPLRPSQTTPASTSSAAGETTTARPGVPLLATAFVPPTPAPLPSLLPEGEGDGDGDGEGERAARATGKAVAGLPSPVASGRDRSNEARGVGSRDEGEVSSATASSAGVDLEVAPPLCKPAMPPPPLLLLLRWCGGVSGPPAALEAEAKRDDDAEENCSPSAAATAAEGAAAAAAPGATTTEPLKSCSPLPPPSPSASESSLATCGSPLAVRLTQLGIRERSLAPRCWCAAAAAAAAAEEETARVVAAAALRAAAIPESRSMHPSSVVSMPQLAEIALSLPQVARSPSRAAVSRSAVGKKVFC